MKTVKLVFAFFGFIILYFYSGCCFNEAQENLTFIVKSNKELYPERETVKITLELTNNTQQSVKILTNTGFVVALKKNSGSITSWWSPSANPGEFVPSWQVLKPGESYNISMDITDNYSPNNTSIIVKPPYIIKDGTVMVPGNDNGDILRLLSQGDYTICGEYLFSKDKAKAMGISIDKADESSIWFGKVTSNTIKITIKPKQ